jgi:light-regulated signal transduction histidine kinase (bacteriophytochrome)
LIEDILAFSKIGFQDSSLEETDLCAIIDNILIEMDDFIKEKKAEIIIGEIPVLKLVPGLMFPLFQNLISNALKYSRRDVPPRIKIYSEMVPGVAMNENGGSPNEIFCRIFIEDNGIGFEQQYAEKVFAMFSRLHQNSEYQGTGIGLALCKKIVEQHNGYISARSNVNEGSVFILSFPIHVPVNANKAELKTAI